MYKLTKLALDEEVVSYVEVGYSVTGHNLSIVDNTGILVIIDDLEDITEGYGVLLTRGLSDYLRTSPVDKIIFKEPNKIVFKTQTSYYELEDLKDAEN